MAQWCSGLPPQQTFTEKRAAGIILHADYNTPPASMFEELIGLLPIHKQLRPSVHTKL